jgi:hypothetical protein
MSLSKAAKRIEQERFRRHANIRRGMRIALYEINQTLAARGEKIVVPPGWIDYTVALAEGGRRKAPFADVVDRIVAETAQALQAAAAARAQAIANVMNRLFR